jgi:uncharacterized glyoxalase superfamily protein PhnB
MFWGDRYGQLKDPFGVLWAVNAPVKKAAARPRAKKRAVAA